MWKNIIFWLWKVQQGTSSLHKEMERPSNKFAWCEENFSITLVFFLVLPRRMIVFLVILSKLALSLTLVNIIRIILCWIVPSPNTSLGVGLHLSSWTKFTLVFFLSFSLSHVIMIYSFCNLIL